MKIRFSTDTIYPPIRIGCLVFAVYIWQHIKNESKNEIKSENEDENKKENKILHENQDDNYICEETHNAKNHNVPDQKSENVPDKEFNIVPWGWS